MNIAVCDDFDADANTLIALAKRYFDEIHAPCEITRFRSGKELTGTFSAGQFPIVFMDIYMDGQNPDGMEASAFIREKDAFCKIIFITSSRDFAVDSHRLRAVHYLVKAVTYEDVKESLDRCHRSILREMQSVKITASRNETTLFLKDIYYIEYIKRKTVVHTKSERIETYTPLNELEALLQSPAFLRCHKGFIVNMDNVSRFQDDHFVMKDGARVNIRQRGAKEIKDVFTRYFFEKTLGRNE